MRATCNECGGDGCIPSRHPASTPGRYCVACDGNGFHEIEEEEDGERSVANVLEDIHLVLCTQSRMLERIAETQKTWVEKYFQRT